MSCTKQFGLSISSAGAEDDATVVAGSLKTAVVVVMATTMSWRGLSLTPFAVMKKAANTHKYNNRIRSTRRYMSTDGRADFRQNNTQ